MLQLLNKVDNSQVLSRSFLLFLFPQSSAYKIFILNNYIFTYQAKEYVNFPSSISLILRNHIVCISDRVDDLMYFGALFLII